MQPVTPQHAARPSTSTVPQPVPAVTPAPVAPTAARPKHLDPGTKTPPLSQSRRSPHRPRCQQRSLHRNPRRATPAPWHRLHWILPALKEQLKETQAIGVFTKVSLKNQVDDLLQQFRDYYQGKAKVTMAQLRRFTTCY